MEELFEELKHHEFEEIYFVAERYEIHLVDGITVITSTSERMLNSLRAIRTIRTASNHDARAEDSEGGCRE